MSVPVRTYGGWRERRGFGIGTLSGPQTAAGLVVVVVAMGVVLVAPAALPILAIPAAVVAGLLLLRVRGESLAAVGGRHLRWRMRHRRRATSYRAFDSTALPGVLHSVHLVTEGTDTPAVLLDRARGTVTTVVPVEPQGLEFMPAEAVEQWVGGWGRWLAHLGYIPDLAHVAVTVCSRPCESPGHRAAADGLMAEIRAQLHAEHVARTLITVTVDIAGQSDDAARRRLQEAVESLAALEQCGVTVLPGLDEAALASWVRDCHQPAGVTGAVDAGWTDARPTATDEYWHAHRHDGGWSAAFAWDESPGETMGPRTLRQLFEPAPYAKRVTFVYAPVPAHTAARDVDHQTQAAVFRSQYRRRLGRDETARDRLDVERAQQTAQEQARGSGLVDVGLYAVATTASEAALEQAAADLHNRAGQARLRLRRAYGEQAAVFAATLGLGYVPRRGR